MSLNIGLKNVSIGDFRGDGTKSEARYADLVMAVHRINRRVDKRCHWESGYCCLFETKRTATRPSQRPQFRSNFRPARYDRSSPLLVSSPHSPLIGRNETKFYTPRPNNTLIIIPCSLYQQTLAGKITK